MAVGIETMRKTQMWDVYDRAEKFFLVDLLFRVRKMMT